MSADSLHTIELISKGEAFLRIGDTCNKIGQLNKGVMRGVVLDIDGNEITTHFYQEGDLIIGGFLPEVNMTYTIEALEDCEIESANYAEVMSQVNTDPHITTVINAAFQKLNKHLHSRLVSLLNLGSVQKYEMFIDDYPGLVNRIPHYYIAQYLLSLIHI